MEKIVNALLAHDWTIETIFLILTILVLVPIKGESALKTILTHFKSNKEHDLLLLKQYDKLIEQYQEDKEKQDKIMLDQGNTIKDQGERIDALELKLERAFTENKELREENYKLRNIG